MLINDCIKNQTSVWAIYQVKNLSLVKFVNAQFHLFCSATCLARIKLSKQKSKQNYYGRLEMKSC